MVEVEVEKRRKRDNMKTMNKKTITIKEQTNLSTKRNGIKMQTKTFASNKKIKRAESNEERGKHSDKKGT